MPREWEVGDAVPLTGWFFDGTGSPADPTLVGCNVTEPNGVETAIPGGSIARTSAGVYETTFAPTLVGLHWFQFVGTPPEQRTLTDTFIVKLTPFA